MSIRFFSFIRPVCFTLAALCLAAPDLLAQSSGNAVTIQESVHAALGYNPELKASQEAREISRHAVDRAGAGHKPNLTLSAGAGVSRRDDANTRGLREAHQFRTIADADLRLTQPLFHGWATTEGVAKAKEDLAAADSMVEDRGLAIVYTAIAAHTDVVRRADLVALAERNVTEHAKILDNVQNRYHSGVATAGELNQVQSRHSRAKATLATYKSALDAARANYLRVTGRVAGELAPPSAPAQVYASLEDVRDATLAGNPAIHSALAEFRAATHEKEQVKSRFYPQFDLVAGPTWSERQSSKDAHVSDLSAEVRMSWDLFSGGADQATVRMAGAKIRQARQNLHGLMNSLNEDIEATFSRYTASALEAAEYDAAKTASRNAREDYYRQFSAAQRGLVDVLDAENDYFYAASQEVMSRSDRVLSAYRLLAISGALLSEMQVNPVALHTEGATIGDESWANPAEVASPLIWGGRNSR